MRISSLDYKKRHRPRRPEISGNDKELGLALAKISYFSLFVPTTSAVGMVVRECLKSDWSSALPWMLSLEAAWTLQEFIIWLSAGIHQKRACHNLTAFFLQPLQENKWKWSWQKPPCEQLRHNLALSLWFCCNGTSNVDLCFSQVSLYSCCLAAELWCPWGSRSTGCCTWGWSLSVSPAAFIIYIDTNEKGRRNRTSCCRTAHHFQKHFYVIHCGHLLILKV